MNNLFTLKSTTFEGNLCYLNTTTELELSNNISTYLHHVPKNHIYSLLTPELVIGNNKRLDFGTDILKFKQHLPKDLRSKVGSCINAKLMMVELKRDKVNLDTFNETILSSYESGGGKRYLKNYIDYCEESDVKIKELTILFVAPNVIHEAQIKDLNEDFRLLTKNFVQLNFMSYTKFFSKIYNLLPWYVTQELPPLFFSIDKGRRLIESKLAIKQ